MASTTLPVQSVTGGMTQIPAHLAGPDKVKDIGNMVPIPNVGLAPRAGTRHLRQLFSKPGPDVLLHPIDIGGNEKYLAAISHGNVRVFAHNGDEFDVRSVTRNAAGAITGGAAPDFDYLDLRTPNFLHEASTGTLPDPEGFNLGGWIPAGGWGVLVGGDGANPSPLGFQSTGPGPAPDDMTVFRDNGTGALGVLAATFQGWNERRLRFSIWVDTTGITNHVDRFGLALYFFGGGNPQYIVDWDFGGNYTAIPTAVQNSSDGSIFLTSVEQPNGAGTGLFRLSFLFDPDRIAGANPAEGATNWSAVLRVSQGPGGAVVGSIEGWGALIEEHPDRDDPAPGPYAYPPGSLRTVQAVGTSFVANPAIKTRLDTSVTATTLLDVYGTFSFNGVGAGAAEVVNVSDAAYIFVRQGATNTSYTWELVVNDPTLGDITFGGTTTTTTGATADDTDAIATLITTAINTHASNTDGGAGGNAALLVEAQRKGSVILLRAKGGGGTFVTFKKVETTDSLGDLAMTSWHNTIDSVSKLPRIARDDTRVRLTEKTDLTGDIAPVQAVLRFVATQDAAFTTGYWAEGVDYGERIRVDETTLPHVLVRRQDDVLGTVTGQDGAIYFEWNPHTWDDKAVGDDEVNPPPSFATPEDEEDLVDRYITAIGFFKSRLFLASSSHHVCASEVSRFGNFWRTTVQTIPDSDRIDLAISTSRSTVPHDFVEAQSRLYLPCGNGVLGLVQGDVLSPRSVGIVTCYVGDVSSKARAVEVPGGFVFTSGTTRFDQVMLAIPVADDKLQTFPISGDIPRLIRSPIDHLEWADAAKTLYVTSATDRGYIWAARLSLGSQGLEQLAWFRMYGPTDAAPDQFRSMACLGGDLFVAIERNSTGSDDEEVFLERLPLDPDPVDDAPDGGTPQPSWDIRLDRRITEGDLLVATTYAAGPNQTTFTLPYHMSSAAHWVVRREYGSNYGLRLTSVGGTSNTIVVSGNHLTSKVYIGATLTGFVEPLPPVYRDFRGQAVGDARIIAKSALANFVRSAYGRVSVTDLVGTTFYDGFGTSPVFPIVLVDREVDFGVMSRPEDLNLRVVTYDTYPFLPTVLGGFQWIIDLVRRGGSGR